MVSEDHANIGGGTYLRPQDSDVASGIAQQKVVVDLIEPEHAVKLLLREARNPTNNVESFEGQKAKVETDAHWPAFHAASRKPRAHGTVASTSPAGAHGARRLRRGKIRRRPSFRW